MPYYVVFTLYSTWSWEVSHIGVIDFFEGVTDPGGHKSFTSENPILQLICLRLIVGFNRVQLSSVKEDNYFSYEWVNI